VQAAASVAKAKFIASEAKRLRGVLNATVQATSKLEECVKASQKARLAQKLVKDTQGEVADIQRNAEDAHKRVLETEAQCTETDKRFMALTEQGASTHAAEMLLFCEGGKVAASSDAFSVGSDNPAQTYNSVQTRSLSLR
jgi:hypothetical protein